MNTLKKSSNKNKIAIILSVIFVIAIVYIQLLKLTTSYRPIQMTDTILFIKSFDVVLAVLAAMSCILFYNSTKKEELFILSLLYIVFCIDIAFGNIDSIDINSEVVEMSNYILMATSLMRVTILVISILPLTKFKKLIINNKMKSIGIVTITSIIIGMLRIDGLISNDFASENQFILYNSFLFIIYIVSAFTFFIKSIKEKEYIYAVIGTSIFLFSIKWIYSIVDIISPSSHMKLASIFVTYIGFIIFIAGVMLELILNTKKNKELECELLVFKKIADENKISGIIIYNENKEIVYTNNTAKIYWSKDEYIESKNLEDVILKECKEIKESKLEEIKKHITELGFWSGSMRLDKEGTVLNATIQKIETSNGINFVVIFKDVSHRVREKSALLEYEKMKGQEVVRNEFFANISHELRTPLNIFYSTIQLLDMKINSDDFKYVYIKHKNSLKTNCQRMLRLINNIVDITKIDVGFTKPRFVNIDISYLVEEVTMSVLNYAKPKNINIVFDTEVEEQIIKCDPEMMERVILNLLSNSIKFTNENGNIWVSMYSDKEYIHIRIKDDGIGIPLEAQSTIFDRFVQGDKSLTRLNEGSGIGLSIVHSIVTLNDGEIYLDSDGESGTEFEIILPNEKLGNEDDIEEEYSIDIQKIELELSDIYELY